MVSDEEKKKVILSILAVNAKTGATITKINREYENLIGEKLALSKQEGMHFMSTLENVVLRGDLYYTCSEKSSHVTKLVANQFDNRKQHFRPQQDNLNRYNPPIGRNNMALNNSLPHRPLVTYGEEFSNVNIPQKTTTQKIMKRRQTIGFRADTPSDERRSGSGSPQRSKRRRSITPDPAKRSTLKRSRSRSPPQPRWDNANRSRWNDTNRSNQRNRSQSRPRRSPSPRARRSPPAKRSTWRPPSNSPPPRTSASHYRTRSRSPPRTRSPRNQTTILDSAKSPRRSPTVEILYGVNDKYSQPSTSKCDPTTKQTRGDTTVGNNNKTSDSKAKKFKFTVIGDGYIYYQLSDMQSDVNAKMPLCEHTLSCAEARSRLDLVAERLRQKRKKVLISIGATDLRNGKPLYEMKRDFTRLFMFCQQKQLKPLITTIMCFDTPELKTKADIFNDFLLDSFENVIDLRQVQRIGFAEVTMSLNEKYAMQQKRSLSVGTLQQLVLNVNK